MADRLENLRMFFPAEVTGAYLAIQSLYKANDIGPSERPGLMLFIAFLLIVANVVIYWKYYNIQSPFLQAILAIGFLVWIGNMDTDRFKDIPVVGPNIKIGAPILLIFYTLITSFMARPERIKDRKPA